MGKRKIVAAVSMLLAIGMGLSGCAHASTDQTSASDANTLKIGTTDVVSALDPAGASDTGSVMLMTQIYGQLMNQKPGSSDPEPELAESGEFVNPTTYRVKLRKGLKFANGNPINAEAVKFSLDRQAGINDPNGPQLMKMALKSTKIVDDLTVDCELNDANDQTFPGILTANDAAIVDPKVFGADKITSIDDIIKGRGFSGPYELVSYSKGVAAKLKANANYSGVIDKVKTDTVMVNYYSSEDNLKLNIQQHNIDVAWNTLSAKDIETLGKDSSLKVHSAPGGSIRYLTFNFNTMPYGAQSDEPDAAKALAVRQAIADLVDRQAIADRVYKGTYVPLYSNVPDGITGATQPFKELYGDGNGGPDAAKAKKRLSDAGVKTPVNLNIQYNTDHYGASSADEYALIKEQLESSGLFKVTIQSTEWSSYAKKYSTGEFPIFQLGGSGEFSDGDDFLSIFYGKGNFLQNGYENEDVYRLLAAEKTEADKTKRNEILAQVQEQVAKDISNLDLLQGQQIAVAGTNVQGVDNTLDGSFKFRLGVLSK
ncbi:ABC transporter substrate-binding protein [Bifidobacterium olomucense]|uniref:Peptide ABC transporter substrate-binding protein n=1 Tax=Bifidobacterium olomucense TaxID=2675324 RepID=A0A7Y0EXT7_9BIFI|nr:ABC transporter substrate-binding protein [Bifidobacterium sp. DSM 109959]NMM98391.1 peptide ABC transporter substrate-binding protein [Bifidobacterium sp. DSM 109959]